MMTSCASRWLVATVLVLVTGCMSGATRTPMFLRAPGEPDPVTETPRAEPATVVEPEPALSAESAAPADEIQRVVAELAASGAIGPAEQAQLTKDLAACDPALRPQMLQLFRTSLAYRERASHPTPAPAEPEPNEVAVVAKDEAPPASKDIPSSEPAESVRVADRSSDPPSEPQPASKPDDASLAVRVASHAEPLPVRDWQVALTESIVSLEKSLAESSNKSREPDARLRLLYLAAGRRDDALRPLAGVEGAEQQFYSGEMFGLAAYLNPQREDQGARAAEVQTHLRTALDHLAQAAPLVVRNLAFCTEITSYGVYTPFAKHEFKPGQQVLLYVEVENLSSNQTPRGYHTALKSSYQILDAQGHRVESRELPAAEEDCKNQRRDYFIRYFLNMPERLFEGRYTLQLTIEDEIGKKIGQSSIEFSALGSKQ